MSLTQCVCVGKAVKNMLSRGIMLIFHLYFSCSLAQYPSLQIEYVNTRLGQSACVQTIPPPHMHPATLELPGETLGAVI